MTIYFACTGKPEPRCLARAGFKNILLSYHYYAKDVETINCLKEMGVTVFMDSGAFSAKNAGAVISIDAYSYFLCKHNISLYVSLDVIGDAVKTYENWMYMKQRYKLNPIPTFHMNEPMEYLERYLNECDYIAFGGMVGSDSSDVDGWITRAFTLALNKNPNVKIHGFGMTTTELIYKYPWHSFDSSSFKSGKRYGRIPQFNGRHLYQISIKKFQLRYREQFPGENYLDVNDSQFKKAMDIEGATAYNNLVEYLS